LFFYSRRSGGCYGTSISGADGTAIGTGKQNTIDIETSCTTPETAADICANLVMNGYNDWFLPSKFELVELYVNRAIIGGFSTDKYWSSSEQSAFNAWSKSFSTGIWYGDNKNSSRFVRAIRGF